MTAGARKEIATGWAHFEHGADAGLRAWGPTLEATLEQAGLALTAVVTDPAKVRPAEAVRFELHGQDPDTLLYDWLNALIYEMATRRMLFARFRIRRAGEGLQCEARGERVDAARHAPAVEIKGATYTTLHVRQGNDGGWLAECVVDV